jgi:hypothetical protein
MIYRSGIVRIDGLDRARLELDGAKTHARQARADKYGMVVSPGGWLKTPEDWLLIADEKGTFGSAVLVDAGAEARYDGKRLHVKKGSICLAPAADEAGARAARATTHPSLAVRETDQAGQWKGTVLSAGRRASVTVIDRNDDGRPDAAGDIWTIDRKGDGKAELLLSFLPADDAPGVRVAYFRVDGKDLADIQLQEHAVRADDPGRRALAGIIADDSGLNLKEFSASDAIKPVVIVTDFDGDGAPVDGSLLWGGPIAGDQIARGLGEPATAWDLNVDGLTDIWYSGDHHQLFNYRHELNTLWALEVDVTTGRLGTRKAGGYDLQKTASMFSKTNTPGRYHKGAGRAFEDHFFVDIDHEDYPELFRGDAVFFFYTNGNQVNRMSMGRLSGSKALRAWEIELDPIHATEKAEWEVKVWKDTRGREVRLNTISGPDQWDGQTLDIEGYLAGWYAMTNGRYKTASLRATFSPPGSTSGSAEGMYGGALTTQERIELDEDGGSYVMYYSPLMGDLHLKGADYGAYAIPSQTPDFWLDINRYYHREAHLGSMKDVGAMPDLRFPKRESKRLEGPVFLNYTDADNDGFFDTYVYDVDNDGLFDRNMYYRHDAGVVQLSDGKHLAAWPEKLEFQEVEFVPENYDRLADLRRHAWPRPPMVVSTQMGSGGIPVKIQTVPFYREVQPEFFMTFGPEWLPTVAIDAAHTPRDAYGWTDFKPTGLSRVGTMFANAGMTQTVVAKPWSADSLEDVDILLVGGLTQMPSEAEITAVRQWMADGGTLILNTPTDESQRMRMQALGTKLNFALADQALRRRAPVYRYACLGQIHSPTARSAIHRVPGPWNEIRHFGDPQGLGLLEGFEYLSFVGYPIERIGGTLKPLLTYEGKTLMASGKVGRGQLVVSGVDWWTNRYIWHHEEYENETQNEVFLQRVVEKLASTLPVLTVNRIENTPQRVRAEWNGAGGTLRFSRRYGAMAYDLAFIEHNMIEKGPRDDPFAGTLLRTVKVNGKTVQPRQAGVLLEIDVPAGKGTLEIDYQKAEPEDRE